MEELSPKVKLVYNHLLQGIRGLPVGMPVPSVAELRSKFNVGQLTVQRACDTLEAMGKVRRIPRKGVFVGDPTEVGEIAIVITPRALQPEASMFYSRAVAALAAEISGRVKNLQVRLHLGKDMGLHEHTIEKYAESLGLDDKKTLLRLRGVVTFYPIGMLQDKLISRGIPVCGFGANTSSFVTWNQESFLRGSLEYAASRGFKDVSFFGFSGWLLDPERHILELERLMSEYGFELRPEWEIYIRKRMTSEVGYELFNRLWNSSNKPQLIIAIDDVACSGMLKAVNDKGLDIPRDFQLITFANKGMMFPYGREITRYEVDSSVQARKAVEMVLGQCKNGTAGQAETVILEPIFVKGQTTL